LRAEIEPVTLCALVERWVESAHSFDLSAHRTHNAGAAHIKLGGGGRRG
jgi:hypothetical protein